MLGAGPDVLAACKTESRCLVTLDLDFSNPLRFVPSDCSGIAVLRLPPKPSRADLQDAVQTLASGLETRSISKRLWVVQPGRIREYQEPGADE